MSLSSELSLSIFSLKYSDRWVIQVKAKASANQIASRHGMENLGQIMQDHDYYAFRQDKLGLQDLSDSLSLDGEVCMKTCGKRSPLLRFKHGGHSRAGIAFLYCHDCVVLSLFSAHYFNVMYTM
jgi:hypothetical protein